MNRFTNPYQFDENPSYKALLNDYSEAKAAQRELVQARKVIWLLLRQIGEPVTIDETSLVQVPNDAELLECFEPDEAGFITLRAK